MRLHSGNAALRFGASALAIFALSGCILGIRQHVTKAETPPPVSERYLGESVKIELAEHPLPRTMADTAYYQRSAYARDTDRFEQVLRRSRLFESVTSTTSPTTFVVKISMTSERRGNEKSEELFYDLSGLSLFLIPSIQDRTIVGSFDLLSPEGQKLWSGQYREDVRFIGWLPFLPLFFLSGQAGGLVERRAELNIFKRAAGDLVKFAAPK